MAADGIEIVRARILSLSDIVDRVTEQGVYPVVLPPEATPPCISISTVGASRPQTLRGGSKQFMQRVSVEITAAKAQDAIDIGKLVVSQLPCIKETMAALGAHLVDIVFADTIWDDNSDDRSTFRRGTHFRVHWQDL